MTTAAQKCFRIFGVLLGCLLLLILLPFFMITVIELLFHILFGWMLFLKDTISSVSVFWPSIITGIIAFFFVLIGTHSAIKWYKGNKRDGEAKNDDGWKFRWSLAMVLLIVITFTAGIAMTGLVHQFYWLSRDGAPFHSYGTATRRGLCDNNLRLIDHAKGVASIKNGWTNGYVIADSSEEIEKLVCIYIDGGAPVCPEHESGASYTYNPVGVPATCSYDH